MQKRVLLVDDNKAVRDMLKTVLMDVGYEVVEASDGLDGLTKAKASLFDVFIIDYKMPIMDGISLIKGLKEMPKYSDSHIVLLTTDDGAGFVSKVAAINDVSVMCKPIDNERLLSLLLLQQSLGQALLA